jgi:hypothetical protein
MYGCWCMCASASFIVYEWVYIPNINKDIIIFSYEKCVIVFSCEKVSFREWAVFLMLVDLVTAVFIFFYLVCSNVNIVLLIFGFQHLSIYMSLHSFIAKSCSLLCSFVKMFIIWYYFHCIVSIFSIEHSVLHKVVVCLVLCLMSNLYQYYLDLIATVFAQLNSTVQVNIQVLHMYYFVKWWHCIWTFWYILKPILSSGFTVFLCTFFWQNI